MNSSQPSTVNMSDSTTLNPPYSVFVDKFNAVLGIIILILTPWIIIINAFLIATIVVFKHMWHRGNHILLSLAVADLSVGLFTCPTYALFYLHGSYSDLFRSRTPCLIKITIVVLCCGASVLNILVLVIDRYIAICHPYSYFLQRRTIYLVVMLCPLWLFCFVVSSLPFMGWNNFSNGMVCDFFLVVPKMYIFAVVIGTFMLSFFILVILNIKMLITIRHIQLVISAAQRKETDMRNVFDKEIRAAKVAVVKFIIFVFFWAPYFIAMPVKYTRLSDVNLEVLQNSALVLALSNSLANPLVHAFAKDMFRNAFVLLLTTPVVRWNELRNARIERPLSTSTVCAKQTLLSSTTSQY